MTDKNRECIYFQMKHFASAFLLKREMGLVSLYSESSIYSSFTYFSSKAINNKNAYEIAQLSVART